MFNLNKFVIVDIETTGNSLKKGDRIIQFASVTIEEGAITDTYTTFINPETEISPFITELTGIDNELVDEAPKFSEIADDILRIMEGACFVAHNVHFDLSFLQDELEYAGREKLVCPILDTVELSRILMPTLESYKLQEIANFAGFDHDRPHQADSDALVTAEWFLTLLEKAKNLPASTIYQLKRLSKEVNTDLYMIFNQIYIKKLNTIENLDPSLEEYRGIILKQTQSQSFQNKQDYQFPDSPEEIKKLLQVGYGAGFEKRKEQSDMIQLIHQSLESGELVLIEAEPGFGKTISFLLPAAIHSINKNKPVVIATHTIQGQHQIIEQEVPRLQRMLNRNIQCSIVKGKSHYLNLWKFERLLHQDSENYDETIAKMQILVWLLETDTGDLDELNLSSGGLFFWKRVAAEFGGGTENNPWEVRDYYNRALINANEANLIITNHHFLMADMTGSRKFLPEYDDVIIDEAHHFERNSAQFFGSQLTFRKIKYWLSQLGNIDQSKLVSQIISVLSKKNNPVQPELLQKYMEHFSRESGDFFQICTSLTMKKKRNAYGKTSSVLSFHNNQQIIFAWERLYDAFIQMFSLLEDMYRMLLLEYDNLNEAEKLLIEDYSLILLEISKIEQIHDDLMISGDKTQIVWVESDDRAPVQSTGIYIRPLIVGEYLAKHLYTEKKAIIFTSATLTVKNTFEFITEQLGLDNFSVIKKQFKASFPYQEQVQLFALKDVPAVTDTDQEEFIEVISSSIISIAANLEGRILVLFTSHEMLKNTYYLIKESEALEDYAMFAQGISGGSSHRLAKQFNRFDKALLFGSYTFWEGVDIGKESLAAIIMVRLPFSSPQEPVHKGKVELIKATGKNPFYEYSLPEAVIRFKQGFGRLIRSNQNKGLFIICDNRIITSRYRDVFLKSIPKLPLHIVNIDELCDQMN